jgi:hypothetical protein
MTTTDTATEEQTRHAIWATVLRISDTPRGDLVVLAPSLPGFVAEMAAIGTLLGPVPSTPGDLASWEVATQKYFLVVRAVNRWAEDFAREWETFAATITTAHAAAYLDAGLTLTEARAIEAAGDVDLEALAMLGALRA